MNNYTENTETIEIGLHEFDTEKLPSLDDLMRELHEAETAANEQAAAARTQTAPDAAVSAAAQNNDAAQRLAAENKELAARLERVAADFEKYRWRAERERSEHYAFAVASIVNQFLPVLDNFERALASVDASRENQNFAQFVSGIEMIYQQNIKYLQDIGVSQLKTVGKEFNPRFHEAVSTEPRTDVAPNTIIEEILRGYQMGDKLIRAAMVKVSVNGE